jgi:hypothetical protein
MGVFIGEDADDLDPPLDVVIESLGRVGHVRKCLGLGLVQEAGKFGRLRGRAVELVGDLAPRRPVWHLHGPGRTR